MIIYAYNHHVRLLPPEPVVVKQPQFTRVEGVGIVMQSSVAVGTPVTQRPPHRSALAAFLHAAPTVDIWRQSAE
jgi:hypothetical protein